MDLTAWVDVAIGLTIVYLGASLYVTIINEYIAQVLNRRAKQLGADLKELIKSPTLITKLKENPALAPFFTDGRLGGSYIDTKVLAQELVGALRVLAVGVGTIEEYIKSIDPKTPNIKLESQLLTLYQMASNDLEKFVQSVSVWIDSSLTMMGEMYKRNTQRNSFWIGLAMAISFNLNTVSITNHLYRDKEARETIAAYATDFGNKVKDDVIAKCNSLTEETKGDAPDCKAVDELRQGLLRRSGTFGKLPIGWGEGISAFSPTAVPGWLLTALAISLGAPFWFDLLNRLINIRHGMKRPTVSKEEGKP